jgi:hypothetical protein
MREVKGAASLIFFLLYLISWGQAPKPPASLRSKVGLRRGCKARERGEESGIIRRGAEKGKRAAILSSFFLGEDS